MVKSSNDNKNALIEEVTELLYENLGTFARDKYKEFYKNRTKREILLSCRELMRDLIGEKKANQCFQRLSKKYDVKINKKYVV